MTRHRIPFGVDARRALQLHRYGHVPLLVHINLFFAHILQPTLAHDLGRLCQVLCRTVEKGHSNVGLL